MHWLRKFNDTPSLQKVGQSGGVWYKETLLHLEDEIKRKNVVA
jgi:hypothetical protein